MTFTYAAPLLWNKLPVHLRLIDSTAFINWHLKHLFLPESMASFSDECQLGKFEHFCILKIKGQFQGQI